MAVLLHSFISHTALPPPSPSHEPDNWLTKDHRALIWSDRLGFGSAVSSGSMTTKGWMSHYGKNEKPHGHHLSDTQEIWWSRTWLTDWLTVLHFSAWKNGRDERNMTPDWMELHRCVLLCLQRPEKILSGFNSEIFSSFYPGMPAHFQPGWTFTQLHLKAEQQNLFFTLGFQAALLGQLRAKSLVQGHVKSS